MMKKLTCLFGVLLFTTLFAGALAVQGEEAVEESVAAPALETPEPAVSEEPAQPAELPVVTNKLIVLTKEKPAPSFVVFLPEQIDTIWYWYYFTEEQQCIVQGLVEKALLRAGYDIIDLSMANLDDENYTIEQVTSPREAVKLAKQLGATYAIVGKASATMASRDVAYGINVVRSAAEASARIIRVSDGKVMAIEESSSKGGGQAQKIAAQGALKEAGGVLAARLCSQLNLLFLP
ncbi:MAG: hypothetical protein V2A34_15030 [Lentisphaerota bacterium]